MALIVDAGMLYAQADVSDGHHEAAVMVLRSETGELITSELAVAEADYLILSRLGIDAELSFLDDLAEGTFVVECLSRRDLDVARQMARRYRDLQPGLADCSLTILADRYRTLRIATFNQRDFRTLRTLRGDTFDIVPREPPSAAKRYSIPCAAWRSIPLLLGPKARSMRIRPSISVRKLVRKRLLSNRSPIRTRRQLSNEHLRTRSHGGTIQANLPSGVTLGNHRPAAISPTSASREICRRGC